MEGSLEGPVEVGGIMNMVMRGNLRGLYRILTAAMSSSTADIPSGPCNDIAPLAISRSWFLIAWPCSPRIAISVSIDTEEMRSRGIARSQQVTNAHKLRYLCDLPRLEEGERALDGREECDRR